MPWRAGGSPVVSEVSAVAVVDGATVVMGPPVIEQSVGARWARASSCSHPRPSMVSRTTWRASTAGRGIQAGVSHSRSRRARTIPSMQAPPYAGRTGSGTAATRPPYVTPFAIEPAVHQYDEMREGVDEGGLREPGAVVAGPARGHREADVGARHCRAHRTPPALPRADPSRPQRGGARAVETRGWRGVRARSRPRRH